MEGVDTLEYAVYFSMKPVNGVNLTPIMDNSVCVSGSNRNSKLQYIHSTWNKCVKCKWHLPDFPKGFDGFSETEVDFDELLLLLRLNLLLLLL